jgi:RNA polymerase sigma-70 factor (sigma-E family)
VTRTRARLRDAEFVEFAQASSIRLQQAAYLMCRDWHLAQDLTQATLTKVYLAWGRINRTGGDRYAYARTVLLRQLLDFQRLRRSSEIAVETLPEHPASATEPTTRLTLLDALSLLSPRDRAVVVLRYWEDQSVETTAEALGISASAVRTQSVRALSLLRTHLQPHRDILLP